MRARRTGGFGRHTVPRTGPLGQPKILPRACRDLSPAPSSSSSPSRPSLPYYCSIRGQILAFFNCNHVRNHFEGQLRTVKGSNRIRMGVKRPLYTVFGVCILYGWSLGTVLNGQKSRWP
ncbi:hypothetical protein BDN72DRAFT_218658 [Pluteus cervinus]|uniref:Uncharacterized protein n=1 Tax=Pluteus cervinus TaxID=181527 RepID=A0ACD3AGM5_9AGAR|nr:hypothetical protein BDN72DRAFT_218658 [Pluteus cervinus]